MTHRQLFPCAMCKIRLQWLYVYTKQEYPFSKSVSPRGSVYGAHCSPHTPLSVAGPFCKQATAPEALMATYQTTLQVVAVGEADVCETVVTTALQGATQPLVNCMETKAVKRGRPTRHCTVCTTAAKILTKQRCNSAFPSTNSGVLTTPLYKL